MTFDEYEKHALTTAIYNGNRMLDLCHWALGLSGESGEIAEKLKKIIRDQNADPSKIDRDDIKKELGDILWYITALAHELDINLDDVAKANVEKLASRLQRGVVTGSGDNR